MTAILDGIRRLETAHARGDLSAIDLVAAKARLIDSVPDAAELEEPTAPPRNSSGNTEGHSSGFGPVVLLCTLILTICFGATLLLTGDIMLSTTLAITVLAAFTIMLFRQIDG